MPRPEDPRAQLLEPAVQRVLRHTVAVEEDILLSIAVSLQRIADNMEHDGVSLAQIVDEGLPVIETDHAPEA